MTTPRALSPATMPTHPRPAPLSSADMDDLADRIYDPDRHHTLVVVSTPTDTSKPRINVPRLQRRLPHTTIAVISRPASQQLSHLISEDHMVFGGAVRVYPPRMTRTTPRTHSPLVLVYPHHDPDAAIDRIVDACTEAQARTGTAGADTTTGTADPHTIADAVAKAITPQLGPLAQQALAPMIGRMQAHIDATLTRHLTGSTPTGGDGDEKGGALDGRLPVVYRDPADQLRWEITTRRLIDTNEAHRDKHPLAVFHLTDQFCHSMQADIVPHAKTIAVCAVIAGGASDPRVWSATETHQWFTPDTPRGRMKTADGSIGWRTRIKSGAPGAVRLLWWSHPDGSVTFDHVGHHDDLL